MTYAYADKYPIESIFGLYVKNIFSKTVLMQKYNDGEELLNEYIVTDTHGNEHLVAADGSQRARELVFHVADVSPIKVVPVGRFISHPDMI